MKHITWISLVKGNNIKLLMFSPIMLDICMCENTEEFLQY